MSYAGGIDPYAVVKYGKEIFSLGKYLVGGHSSTPEIKNKVEYHAQDDIHIDNSTNSHTHNHYSSQPISATSNPIPSANNIGYIKMPRGYKRYRRYYKRKYRARYSYPNVNQSRNYTPKLKRYMKGRFRLGGYFLGAKKYLDTYIGPNVIPGMPTGGIKQNIHIVPQGTGFTQRIGRQIWITKIDVRMEFILDAQSDTIANYPNLIGDDLVRIMIVQDRQCNGAAYNYTDLFADKVVGVTTAQALQSMYNLSNFKRFKVLYNRTISLSRSGEDIMTNAAAGTYYIRDKVFNYTFDLKFKRPIIIEYAQGGTSGATSGTTSNCVFIHLFSQNAITTISGDSFVRIRYVDPNK